MTAEEKLKIFAEWAKSVEKLLELDGKTEVEVVEIDHTIDVHIKVKPTNPPPSA